MAPAGAVRRRLAVLADDLTGAADAAAPFADRGLAVSVSLPGTSLPGTAPGAFPDVDVLALLTDNRWRSAQEAGARMRATVERVREWVPDTLFVKIDSTLRGQVHADVAGALDAWGQAKAVATPAFPGQGRVVRGGALVVHGETTVPRVAECFPPGVEVVDAETPEDLVAIAEGIVASDAVAVGSGGLSRALAAVLVVPPLPRSRPRSPVSGVLLVVGTPHTTTRAQVEQAGGELVVAGPGAAAAAVAALSTGRRAVLMCEPEGEVAPESPEAAALGGQLAGVVLEVLDAVPSVGMVLTGGATALAVAAAIGATEYRVLAEVVEGLPLGELVAGDRRVPVVTKSGGFGAQDALHRAAEALEAYA